MKRFLGQYIYHSSKFEGRGFLQINNDKSFTTRLAKPGEEWGNTEFLNGILFPVYSSKSPKELLSTLRGMIPQLITLLAQKENVLKAIEEQLIHLEDVDVPQWVALKGIDLSDLKTIINISIVVL